MINYRRYQGLHYANEKCHKIECLQVLEAGSLSKKCTFLINKEQEGRTPGSCGSQHRGAVVCRGEYGKARQRLSGFLRQELSG